MTQQIFKIPPEDNESKLEWCAYGEQLEVDFINNNIFRDTVLCMNPEKDTDKFTFDMRINFPCDLKSRNTPWRLSEKLFGISPTYAVTIDGKDLRRYSEKYPNICIVFDIVYPDYKNVHYGFIYHFLKMRKEKALHKHEYKERKNDTKGNAKDCYIFDIRNLPILRRK
tara:strand:+ start:798 stop:1301 length:504 start_codon:yes stop_codon:yes gene_type:complete